MEFGEAKAIGDVGERVVADRLTFYCQEHPPAGFLSNLLLSVGKMTAQLDLVLVDPKGILIVEVKVRHGLIRGTTDEHKWTAVYHGSTKTFQNPLEQLRSQRNALSKALKSAGTPIALDLIQGCVVFVDADIDSLELDSESGQRVTTEAELPELLLNRGLPGGPALSHEEIVLRYGQLKALDHTGDAATEAHHAEYRGGPRAAAAASTPVPAGPRAMPTLSGNPNRPGPKAPLVSEPTALSTVSRIIGAVVNASEPGPKRPQPSRSRESKRARALRSFVIDLVVIGLLLLCASTGACQQMTQAFVASTIKASMPR